jgi:hypothetical protein
VTRCVEECGVVGWEHHESNRGSMKCEKALRGDSKFSAMAWLVSMSARHVTFPVQTPRDAAQHVAPPNHEP